MSAPGFLSAPHFTVATLSRQLSFKLKSYSSSFDIPYRPVYNRNPPWFNITISFKLINFNEHKKG
jgi:hypothetical protein